MEQSKPMPEEISQLVYAERVRLYPARRHNGANSMKSIAFKGGAEFMYHRMAEEIEALKKERGMYRKGLEDIIEGFPWSWQAQFAKAALEQYSSPKATENGEGV